MNRTPTLLLFLALFALSCDSASTPVEQGPYEEILSVRWLPGDSLVCACVSSFAGIAFRIYDTTSRVVSEISVTGGNSQFYISQDGTEIIYEDGSIHRISIATRESETIFFSGLIISRAPNNDLYTIRRHRNTPDKEPPAVHARIANGSLDSLRIIPETSVRIGYPLLLANGRVATIEFDSVLQLVIRDSANNLLKRFFMSGSFLNSPFVPARSDDFFGASLLVTNNGSLLRDVVRIRTDIGVVDKLCTIKEEPLLYSVTSTGDRVIYRNNGVWVVKNINTEVETPLHGTETVVNIAISPSDATIALVDAPQGKVKQIRFMALP